MKDTATFLLKEIQLRESLDPDYYLESKLISLEIAIEAGVEPEEAAALLGIIPNDRKSK